mmetsp:Transcript_23653/g.72533  ORF Transcript_23653/g.72533 Transcript_23653/m.72533 type:complete len:218 (+) Transcript_23653:242-895(+)
MCTGGNKGGNAPEAKHTSSSGPSDRMSERMLLRSNAVVEKGNISKLWTSRPPTSPEKCFRNVESLAQPPSYRAKSSKSNRASRNRMRFTRASKASSGQFGAAKTAATFAPLDAPATPSKRLRNWRGPPTPSASPRATPIDAASQPKPWEKAALKVSFSSHSRSVGASSHEAVVIVVTAAALRARWRMFWAKAIAVVALRDGVQSAQPAGCCFRSLGV